MKIIKPLVFVSINNLKRCRPPIAGTATARIISTDEIFFDYDQNEPKYAHNQVDR